MESVLNYLHSIFDSAKTLRHVPADLILQIPKVFHSVYAVPICLAWSLRVWKGLPDRGAQYYLKFGVFLVGVIISSYLSNALPFPQLEDENRKEYLDRWAKLADGRPEFERQINDAKTQVWEKRSDKLYQIRTLQLACTLFLAAIVGYQPGPAELIRTVVIVILIYLVGLAIASAYSGLCQGIYINSPEHFQRLFEDHLMAPDIGISGAMTISVGATYLFVVAYRKRQMIRHVFVNDDGSNAVGMRLIITFGLIFAVIFGFGYLDRTAAILFFLFLLLAYPALIAISQVTDWDAKSATELYKEGLRQMPFVGQAISAWMGHPVAPPATLIPKPNDCQDAPEAPATTDTLSKDGLPDETE